MLNNPKAAITKFSFGKHFSAAWKKGTTVGNAVKGSDPSAIPEDKFLPSTHFLQGLADTPSASTHKTPSESHKPSRPPVLHSTSDLKEAGPSTNTQAKTTAVKTDALSTIISTPEKKMSWKKCRKRQETSHATLDSYFKQTLAKRKLKMEKEGRAKSIPKQEQRRAPNVKGVLPDLHEDSDENTPCGLCGLKYCSVHCVQKGDWIRCQKCGILYHEVCIGAVGRKQFICGKCL
jgi:hypothetical protein